MSPTPRPCRATCSRLYGISLESEVVERFVDTLPGYCGIGPVRVGNQAYEHRQHDVYGHAILAATQAFFDRRLLHPAGIEDFLRLEWLGERAFALHDKPDAGIWELRTRSGVHTSSTVMCWAACDRWRRSLCTSVVPTGQANGAAAPMRSRRRYSSLHGTRSGRRSSTCSAASTSTPACC